MNSTLISLLATCLDSSVENAAFREDRFFRQWFRENGTSYFFTFRKNLSITNIQFAELMALLNTHLISTWPPPPPPARRAIMFYHSDQLMESVSSIVQGYLLASAPDWNEVAECFITMIGNTIAFNPYFGSCAIHLPPGLSIDLARICAESGYIDTCGRLIFLRNVEKAIAADFIGSLRYYCQSLSKPNVVTGDKRTFFVPYGKSDFRHGEPKGSAADDLNDGRRDLKLPIEKLYMKKDSLISVFEKVRKTFTDWLDVATPVPEGRTYQEHHVGTRDRTIFFVLERSISSVGLDQRGDKNYYACYEQLFINDGAFQSFEEDKPGWIAHTTIPHSLCAAMINISRPWRNASTLIACDPFAGSGTSWFELHRLQVQHIRCGDLNPIFKVVVQDNMDFFALPSSSLGELILQYKNVIAQVAAAMTESDPLDQSQLFGNANIDFLSQTRHPYVKAIRFLESLQEESIESALSFRFDSDRADQVEKFSRIEKLVLYTCMRVALREGKRIESGGHTRLSAFKLVADDLVDRLTRYHRWVERFKHSQVLEDRGGLLLCANTYSLSCTTSLQLSASEHRALTIIDATKLPRQSVDLIISDPPYGFNTDEKYHASAVLFRDFLRAFVRALRPHGQLVICLPERSTSGKDIAPFTRAAIVIPQIIGFAESEGRKAYYIARSLPNPPTLFAPPYYWKSSRLDRKILHFRIE